jgi:hypothetical protein
MVMAATKAANQPTYSRTRKTKLGICPSSPSFLLLLMMMFGPEGAGVGQSGRPRVIVAVPVTGICL